VTIVPGRSKDVSIEVDQRRPWTLAWHSNQIGYLQPDNTPISVQAQLPSFTGGSGAGALASAV
jgi:hypothetical protein